MSKKETTKAIDAPEIEATEAINPPVAGIAPPELIAPGDILQLPGSNSAPETGNGQAPRTVTTAELLGDMPSPRSSDSGLAPVEPQAPGPLPDAAEALPGAGAGAPPKKRGRGRPPGSKNKGPGDINPDGTVNFADIDSIATITPEAAATDYQALAELSFDMGTNSLAIVFSDDWKPRDPNERGAVVASLKRYYEHKQIKDIPPGALLCLVLCAYAAPRVNTPTTKDKLKIGWLWLKDKFKRKKTA